jgi:uncharacterized membrane protein (DUF4010 family)
MYLRLLIIIFVFSHDLAVALAPPLLTLSALGLMLSMGWYWIGGTRQSGPQHAVVSRNPLEVTTAATFAALFVVISIATAWATQRFGSAGTYALAAIVGVSDIDPFVLNLAQNDVPRTTGMVAILVATSSNNLVKAMYAMGYSRLRMRAAPAALALLAVGGLAMALLLARS